MVSLLLQHHKWKKGTTAPYGTVDPDFDICKLATGAGSSYVARSTAYHANQLIKYIEKGIENKGFSLIEAISGCPTYYGRKKQKKAQLLT